MVAGEIRCPRKTALCFEQFRRGEVLAVPFPAQPGEAGDDGREELALVALAQQGDAAARERLILSLQGLALSVAASVVGRYLQMGEDDETSIALSALSEAIDAFDPARGVRFSSFASMVIKRRVIDYIRQNHHRDELVFSSVHDEDRPEPPSLVRAAREAWDKTELQGERRHEILEYQKLLWKYGLSLEELVRVAPKHEDARRQAIRVARLVAGRRELVEYMLQRGQLPMRSIEESVALSRKTLERQRKYIMAIVLALAGNFPHLRAYLEGED